MRLFKTVNAPILCSYIAILSILPATIPVSIAASDRSLVSTLAGSGLPGIRDGTAAEATFLMPVALAYGARGEVYVVDEAAQRIRRIERNRVATVAGSGNLDSSGVRVAGGYKDGPVSGARFSDPIGIAVSANGEIYVADSGNHCIRMISSGRVTTVAGSPGRTGQADGPANVASFAYPHALALDGDGRLYVADFGVGIRRINSDGSVETIIREPQGAQHFVSISAKGTGKNVTIYATDLERKYVVATLADNSIKLYDDAAIEKTGSQPLLYGIADVGNDQFIATDVNSSSIRIYRLPQPPFVGPVSGPIIVGAAADDSSATAGDVDGDYQRARFYDPLGLAVRGSMAVIADTGNRKIRIMQMPDTRRSITPASIDRIQRTNSSYRILYVGASYNFYATSWEGSVAGTLERQLNQDRVQLLLSKPVELETLRIDSANLGLQMQFVMEFCPPGQFDLIIFGDEPYYLIQDDNINGRDSTVSAGMSLSLLQTDFGKKTKLMVFVYPEYATYSFVDGLVARELRTDLIGSAARVETAESEARQITEFTASARPVPVLNSFAQFAKLNVAGEGKQLWPIDESHETYRGRQVVAEALFEALKKLHPWR